MADGWWLMADNQMLIAAFQIIANILHLAIIFYGIQIRLWFLEADYKP